jgi:gliding-associated putative ABC transporter substrate-binding component GldG
MLNKKIKQKANFGITVIIIIGIIAVINFFSYQIFYRGDLTQNKDYSISKASKQVAGKLDDMVNIKVYFSENLPSQYINLRQEAGDILDGYAAYSNGKIRVEFIDPGDNEEMKSELYMLGIPELQFNVLEKDKYQVVKGYLGMAVQYGGKTEAIPVVENTDNFEYQVTLAIKKVTSGKMAVIGFVTSNGTAGIDNEISLAYQKLRELYEARQVDLAKEKEIPDDIDALIIVGPKEKFSEDRLKAIDAFLMKGRSVLILADGVKVEEGLIASVNDTGLNNLLEKYGVKINNDLALDAASGIVSFTQGYITFSTNYPFWPKVSQQGFDRENSATAELESLVLPWASTLEVATDKIDKAGKISYLASTTDKAWRQKDNFDLNPQQNFVPSEEKGIFNLAVAISGKFLSAYDNGETDNGRLIVVGDSDFIKDAFLRSAPDNLVFFQNIVDSLSLDEDLINIRSKGVSDRPLKELSDGAKAAIRYLNIFGLTIVAVAFGMIRYYIRRRSMFIDEL